MTLKQKLGVAQLEKGQKTQKKQQENAWKVENSKDPESDIEVSKVNSLKCKNMITQQFAVRDERFTMQEFVFQENFEEFTGACDIGFFVGRNIQTIQSHLSQRLENR